MSGEDKMREKYGIFNIEKGKVLYALETPSDYGNRVYIKHVDNTVALYAHLESFNVKRNDVLEANELIGIMGNTGYSLNDIPARHLHVSYFSQYVDNYIAQNTSDPSFWVQFHSWPTNTKVSNPYRSIYHSTKLDFHEGIDFSAIHFIDNWEMGIDALQQDLMLKYDYPDYFKGV